MLHLIPARQNRPDKDVIFALNGEATRRKQAGESIVNATIGSLMNDDGSLAILDSVASLLKQDGLLAEEASLPANPLSTRVSHFAPKAERCIFIFLEGGPSQMDLFDPKPLLNKYDGQQ